MGRGQGRVLRESQRKHIKIMGGGAGKAGDGITWQQPSCFLSHRRLLLPAPPFSSAARAQAGPSTVLPLASCPPWWGDKALDGALAPHESYLLMSQG